MNLHQFDSPWKHVVVEDFFDKEDYTVIEKLCNDLTILIDSVPQFKRRSSIMVPFYANIKDVFEHASDDLLKRIDDVNEIFPYYAAQLLSNLGIIGDVKEGQPPYSLLPSFVRTKKDGIRNENLFMLGENDIHVDGANKFLSVVIYIGEENSGTKLYSDIDENAFEKEIEWKRNTALVFSRKEYKTWHSVPINQDGNIRKVILFPFQYVSDGWMHVNTLKDYLNEPV